MFAIINKAFGLSRPPEEAPFMPRQIDLSGNVVHFALPENFSRDMPAEDMIEHVDLNDDAVYQDYRNFTLIRRWWDFKDRGFFGKSYGTVMMSLYVKKASDSLGLKTLAPLDFVEIIVDDIKRNMPENPDPMDSYSEYFSFYQEGWVNNQRWTKYFQHIGEPPQFIALYAIPITSEHYMVAEFISAPNNDINARGFVEQFTAPFVGKVMQTFKIEYSQGNPVEQAVMKNEGPTLEQLIEDKRRLLEAQQEYSQLQDL